MVQRAKWVYVAHNTPTSGYFRAPRYIKLIKSSRLIGVHPYIQIRIIKCSGAINCLAVVRVIARCSRNKSSNDRRRGIYRVKETRPE